MTLAIKNRLLGIGLIAMGVGLAWFFGFLPLEAARAHETEVEYSIKMFMVAPMAVLFGIVMLIGGEHVNAGPPQTLKDRMMIWPTFVAALALGGIAWWWFTGQLEALGYSTTL